MQSEYGQANHSQAQYPGKDVLAPEPTLRGLHNEMEDTIARIHSAIDQIESAINGPMPISDPRVSEVPQDGMYASARRSSKSLSHLLDRALKISQRL